MACFVGSSPVTFPFETRDGHIARWYGLMTDIDDRKQAEEALAASQRNLQVTVDTIPALAWSARTDGTADFFNRHYLDYVGRSIDEMAGWAWTSVVHPDDLPQLDPVWQKARETNGSAEWEARLRGADGKYRWFIFRANPLRDETGKVVKWYGINTDIEGRKRAEEALSELRTELAHVSRVSTLGAMTASIAHEVNQPLSGIITNASTCLRMLDGDPPNIDGARETSRRTIRDGNRAAEIVARLRALFSKKCEATDPVDLSEAARDVIALCASELRRSQVEVEADLPGDLPPIAGDRIQLQQVILNLLLNAADALSDIEERPRRATLKTNLDEDGNVRLDQYETTGSASIPTSWPNCLTRSTRPRPMAWVLGCPSAARSLSTTGVASGRAPTRKAARPFRLPSRRLPISSREVKSTPTRLEPDARIPQGMADDQTAPRDDH